MAIKKDYSYGIIPIRLNPKGELEFFTIYQYSSVKGSSYWIFPKGHMEANESPAETALRELQEETGFVATIISDTTFSISYEFMHEGNVIAKEAVFFIGTVADQVFTPQDGEVQAGEWGSYEVILDQLTFNNAKTLLTEVHRYLKQNPKLL